MPPFSKLNYLGVVQTTRTSTTKTLVPVLPVSSNVGRRWSKGKLDIDWDKGTIDNRIPLAKQMDAIRERFGGDIPASDWRAVAKQYKIAVQFQNIIRKGTFEKLTDYILPRDFRLPFDLPAITEDTRVQLDGATQLLKEEAHALEKLYKADPEAVVPAGSNQQKRILGAMLGPHLWLSKAIGVEIKQRGEYPDLPTLPDFMHAAKWGIGLGLGAILFSYLKK